jgi:hypothetical protein
VGQSRNAVGLLASPPAACSRNHDAALFRAIEAGMTIDYEAEHDNRARVTIVRRSSPAGRAKRPPTATGSRAGDVPNSACAMARARAGKARCLSPVYWEAPDGRLLDAVVGADESTESCGRAGPSPKAWRHRAATRYDEMPGANHFTVIERLCDPTDPMVDRLAALCGRTVAAAQS